VVTGDETTLELARRAAEALRAITERPESTCPPGADRFDWSADVLDELARAIAAAGRAVQHVSDRPNDVLARSAEALAQAVVAHRNGLMRRFASGS